MQIVNESMIYKEIDRLLSYGIITGLVEKEDWIQTRKRLLELLELEDQHETGETIQDIGELEEILYYINRFAFEKKIITDNLIECGTLTWYPNGEKLATVGKIKNPSLGTYSDLNDIFLVDKD